MPLASHRLLRVLGLVSATWVLLTVLLYGLSAIVTNDAVVFLTGGSRNITIMFVINFLVLTFAWASPLPMFLGSTETATAVRGRSGVYIVIQIFLLLLLMTTFYFLSTRSVLGFYPVGVMVEMTPDFQQATILRVAVFVIAIGLGTAAGLMALFRPLRRGPEIEEVPANDIYGRRAG